MYIVMLLGTFDSQCEQFILFLFKQSSQVC